MQNILESLKQFLLADYNSLLEELSSVDVPLIQLTEKNICVGYIDLEKNTAAHVVSILPVQEQYEGLTLDTTEAQLQVELYIFARKASPVVLYNQLSRYGQILKEALYANPTISDAISEVKVLDMEIYFGVEGTVDTQATYEFAI